MEKHILESKLKPPDCERFFERERLRHAVSDGGDFRLISVIADAGYGKSTLLAQMLAGEDGSCVWYQMDKGDRDPGLLLFHLIRGVAMEIPGFDAWVAEFLKERKRAEEPDPRLLMNNFMFEFERNVSVPFSFYLDDFHVIDASPSTTDIIQQLVDYMPKNARFVIASRTRPRLSLSRLKSEGSILEISAAELRFTPEEVDAYFADDGWSDLDSGRLRDLIDGAEGWPAALALIRNNLRQRRRRGGPEDSIPAAFGDINEYLAEEVWINLDDRLKELLMYNSLLDVIEPGICSRVPVEGMLTEIEATRLLAEVAELNILVHRIGTGAEFRVHPLFREFLTGQLKHTVDAEGIRRLHRAYAEIFAGRGMIQSAIHHYIEAGMTAELVDAIEQIGGAVLDAGRMYTLQDWLSHVPEEVLESRPWLCYFKSRAMDRELDPEECTRLLRLAREGFESTGDRAGLYGTEYATSTLMMTSRRFDEAIAASLRMVELAGNTREKMKALSRLGLNNMLNGRAFEALSSWGEARELCAAGDEVCRFEIDASMISAKFYLGDFAGIINLAEKMIGRFSTTMPALSRFIVLTYYVVALTETCRYAEARELLSRADELIGSEYRARERYIDVLEARVKLYQGESREGRRAIRDIVDSCKNMFFLGPEVPLSFIGTFDRQKQRFEKALASHEQALALCDEDNIFPLAICLVNIGADKARLVEGKTLDGEAELAEAEELAIRARANFVLSQIAFHRAWLAHLRGDLEKAETEVSVSLGLAACYRYDHFIAWEGQGSIPLIAFAFSLGIERDFLIDICGRIGSRMLSSLAPLLQSEDPVTRKDTIRALAAAGGLSAVPRIQRLLRDRDPDVRSTARRTLDEVRERSARPEDILTPREFEVLEMVAEGATNPEIATRLVVTEPTVKSHVSNIFRKLDVSTRVQAAMYYNQHLPQSDGDKSDKDGHG